MTKKGLKNYYKIKEEKIDNGYRVHKTLKYTREGSDVIIEIDKDDYFGIKGYVMTINGKLAENFLGETLWWETLSQAQNDMVRVFNGQMPMECVDC